MSASSSLSIAVDGPVATVSLNRPQTRNAFDDELISELTAWARGPLPPQVRVAVLRGEGKVFCAGADLTWMSRMVAFTQEENVADARMMSAMFLALDTLAVPLIGRVQGAALGGGAGLAAVCDIVVAAEDAVFGFTEARLGILPAVIAPFAVAKIGQSAARELFLTASRFTAERARTIGLVHAVVPEADLDSRIAQYIRDLSSSAPGAVAAAKRLIARIAGAPPADVAELTADTIARQRVSEEGQAGMRAFLEKRRAPWLPDGH